MKIAPYKQKSINNLFLTGRWAPLAIGALCLSTPTHNGKSGTAYKTPVVLLIYAVKSSKSLGGILFYA